MNDQPTLFDTGNTLVDSLFRRARVLETEGQIDIHLSPQETRVCQGLADGKLDYVICKELNIAWNTLKNYKQSIRQKMGAYTIIQAVSLATWYGIVKH